MSRLCICSFFFFFNDTATTEIYTLSLHDALPICCERAETVEEALAGADAVMALRLQRERMESGLLPATAEYARSEEHTSELQSPCNLVCRLLLEKKKKQHRPHTTTDVTTRSR